MIHIQRGNAKLPKFILNFSLPPEITCPNSTEDCRKYCYAKKFYRMWPSVKKAWDDNLKESLESTFVKNMIERIDKEKDWRVFRWHVSGDIYDQNYFLKITKVIRHYPDKQFYLYTKLDLKDFKYKKPKNLIIIKSKSINIFNIDIIGYIKKYKYHETEYKLDGVSIVLDKKEKNNIEKGWHLCPADCKKCSYCYTYSNNLKKIVFLKH